MNKARNSSILLLGLIFLIIILDLIYFVSLKSIDKLILIGIIIEVFFILVLLISRSKKVKLEIESEKLKYIGSSERERYHKHDCKFVDLIEEKYKLESADRDLFLQKKFKACKNCKPNRN